MTSAKTGVQLDAVSAADFKVMQEQLKVMASENYRLKTKLVRVQYDIRSLSNLI